MSKKCCQIRKYNKVRWCSAPSDQHFYYLLQHVITIPVPDPRTIPGYQEIPENCPTWKKAMIEKKNKQLEDDTKVCHLISFVSGVIWKHFLLYWPFVRRRIGFFHNGPAMFSFDVFFDVSMNQLLNKHSSCRVLAAMRFMWCHCNVLKFYRMIDWVDRSDID